MHRLVHLLTWYSKTSTTQMNKIWMLWATSQMGFHNLMKLLSSLFTHGSRHFSNLDPLENGLRTADQKSLWILGLMTLWPCLSKSTLRPNAVRCMESVENSTFQTSFSIQMEKWQQQGSDSSTPQSLQTMILFEI